MSELFDEIRRRVRVEDVIGARYGLRREGAGFCTEAHDSLKIDPAAQLWTWFSREHAGKPAGGDVIAFLAFERFHNPRMSELSKEQRREVLAEACQLAQVDPAAYRRVRQDAVRMQDAGNGSGSGGTDGARRPKGSRKKGRFFALYEELELAVSGWMERDGWALAKVWTYEARGTSGTYEAALKVLRFERSGADGSREKQIRPCHRIKHGWRLGLGRWGAKQWNAEARREEIARKTPLYRLPAIAKALSHHGGTEARSTASIHFGEGEKCADALHEALGAFRAGSIGTCGQGGCSRLAETDLEPLRAALAAGAAVTIWPDADEPGRAYATGVAAALAGAGERSGTLTVVDVWAAGWSDGADVADAVLEQRAEGKDDAAIGAYLGDLAAKHGVAAEAWAERYAPEAAGVVASRKPCAKPQDARARVRVSNGRYVTRWKADKVLAAEAAKTPEGLKELAELKRLADEVGQAEAVETDGEKAA